MPQFQACDGKNRIEISAHQIVASIGVMQIAQVGIYHDWPDILRLRLVDKSGYSSQIRLTLASDEQSLRVRFRDGTEIIWNRCL